MFASGHMRFGADQLLVGHPLVTDVAMVCPKGTVSAVHKWGTD